MIAAGWSVERAGDLALGPLPGRIRIDLLIVREAAYAATCAALREARWLPGTGWAGAADAGLGGAALVVDAQTPWAGVHALLGQRVLERALLLASDAQVRRHGLPVDVCEVAHVAADLPPAWLRSVREAAASVQIQDGSTPPQVLVTAALARLASA